MPERPAVVDAAFETAGAGLRRALPVSTSCEFVPESNQIGWGAIGSEMKSSP